MPKLISLDKISFNINQQKILSNISLTVLPSEIVTLLGPNGAGKSTLVKIILGLLKPTRGIIEKTEGLTIGYVPQKISLNNILPITVERFIRLNRSLSTASIIKMLELVNAKALLKKSIHHLSGGEIQRILLAQALLKQPQLLVLDEPAQGIDVNGQAILYELIAQARDEFKCGIFMVSHDLHIVMAKTDKVICLNKHVCCSGTPAIIQNDPQFLALFSNQNSNSFALYRHHHTHQHDFTNRIDLCNLGNKNG